MIQETNCELSDIGIFSRLTNTENDILKLKNSNLCQLIKPH